MKISPFFLYLSFMDARKLISAIVLASMASTARPQDVALTSMIYPEPGQLVHLMFSYEIEFVLKNTGSTVVPAATTMSLSMLYDGTLTSPTYTLNCPKLNPGDSISVTIPPQTFSTPNSQIELCIVVKWNSDVNMANDTVCNLMPFTIDNNVDLSPSFIDILIPAVDSVINPGETIYRLGVKMDNLGTVTLPRDYTIKTESKMYNQTRNFSEKTKTAVDSGSFYPMNLLGSQPQVQSQNGTFQICVTLVGNADDVEPANNEYCQLFYAYDWTSLMEQYQLSMKSNIRGENLVVSDCPAEAVVEIYTSTGQLALKRGISAGGPQYFSLSGLDRGIYLVKVVADGILLHSNKIVLQ